MLLEFEAVFENGVFRPLQPVSLPEHARVSVCLRDEQRAATNEPSPDPFDTLLPSLLSDGPTLPDDFSRAHIYGDHS